MNNPADMAGWKSEEHRAQARTKNLEQLSVLGRELRTSRRRRRLGQRHLADEVGLSQSTISLMERGFGGGLTLDCWQAVAQALGRTTRLTLTADTLAEPADAGHLAIQELVLRLARLAGFALTFELPTRPVSPKGWGDIGLRDDRRRILLMVECWNTIGDIGAGVRASDRKRAEAEQYAVAIGPLDDAGVARPYRVRGCWVVRASARNRALVGRYPENLRGALSGIFRRLDAGADRGIGAARPAGPRVV